jgi:hypothetical protein
VTERCALPAADTTPRATVSCSTGAPSRRDASCSSARRASAAALRICGDPRLIAALE